MSVVVAPADDLRSSDTANDEVFLVAEDARTKHDMELADDTSKVCRPDDPVDPPSVGSETVFDEASDTSSPHRLAQTHSTNEETSVCDLSQSDVVLARGTVITSVTPPCQQLTDGQVGTTSGEVVADGRDDRLANDSLAELNDMLERHAGNEVSKASEQTANVRHPSQSSEQRQMQLSPKSPVAPVVRFSELDDFGLDPDLFRTDCLEEDVPFSEKTAKFTRSASPMYEQVLDEDETGLSSVLCN